MPATTTARCAQCDTPISEEQVYVGDGCCGRLCRRLQLRQQRARVCCECRQEGPGSRDMLQASGRKRRSAGWVCPGCQDDAAEVD